MSSVRQPRALAGGVYDAHGWWRQPHVQLHVDGWPWQWLQWVVSSTPRRSIRALSRLIGSM